MGNSYSLEKTYKKIVDFLGYYGNPSFVTDKSGIYDACYYVTINDIQYPVVGIKKIAKVDEDNINSLHLLFWNRNDVPISILIFPGEYRIYNNFTIDSKKKLLTSGKDKYRECEWFNYLSYEKITSTFVWNQIAKLSKRVDRVDKRLLKSLHNTVKYAYMSTNMTLQCAYGFMSQCILVKYLEDRKMLVRSYFQNWEVNSFTELLGKGDLLQLRAFFDALKKRFNGDLFDISIDGFPEDEKQIAPFYRFFSGEEMTQEGYGQLTLFPYNFSIIPIELISNIYEHFFELESEITAKHKKQDEGAYYTPNNLAEFMVDKLFEPWIAKETVPSVLDPACGSGVFLVTSFKRQISILKSRKEMTQEDLINLLKKKIKGVDINIGALRITCFSLYVALLDEMTPKDIEENGISFPNLIGETLICGSFFSDNIIEKLEDSNCDIIVGNPPWKSVPNSDHIEYCKNNGIPISDNQLAQAFIGRAGVLLPLGGISSLLITNSMFTNKNTGRFLDYLLDNYKILDVLNLEKIKSQLFVNATYPGSIITYVKERVDNYEFIFNTFERNGVYNLYNKFVWDRNNDKKVSKNKILGKKYLWNLLIYGDEFDALCMDAIMKFPALSRLIAGEVKLAQGYVPRKNKKYESPLTQFKGGSLNGTFKPYSIDYDNIPLISADQTYDRARNLELYVCSSKLLVKRTYNKENWGAAWISQPLVFSNDFYSFNDYSGNNRKLLMYLEGVINSKLFLYYAFYVSKFKTAKRPELPLYDLCNFPIPEYNNCAEKLVSLVGKMEDYFSKKDSLQFSQDNEYELLKKQIDDSVFEIYGLNDFYIEIINEGIERFHTTSSLADDNDYETFASYLADYCNYYSPVQYANTWKYHIHKGKYYTEVVFYYESEGIDKLMSPDALGVFSIKEMNSTLLIQNQMITFSQYGFSIVQPQNKNVWTKARAMKLAMKMTKLILGERENA